MSHISTSPRQCLCICALKWRFICSMSQLLLWSTAVYMCHCSIEVAPYVSCLPASSERGEHLASSDFRWAWLWHDLTHTKITQVNVCSDNAFSMRLPRQARPQMPRARKSERLSFFFKSYFRLAHTQLRTLIPGRHRSSFSTPFSYTISDIRHQGASDRMSAFTELILMPLRPDAIHRLQPLWQLVIFLANW